MKYTPVFQFAYVEDGDRARDYPKTTKAMVESIEAALLQNGRPPSDADLVSLIARLNEAEGDITTLLARPVGKVTVSGSANHPAVIAAGAYGTPIPVRFPTGTFTAPPNVSVTAGHSRITAAYSALTKDGFTIDSGNWTPGNTGANVGFQWIATAAN